MDQRITMLFAAALAQAAAAPALAETPKLPIVLAQETQQGEHPQAGQGSQQSAPTKENEKPDSGSGAAEASPPADLNGSPCAAMTPEEMEMLRKKNGK